jgi:RimJ/RimL family protein N-acetyltransferase
MTTTEIKALGPPVTGDAARRPERIVMDGAYVTVVPLDRAHHGDALWQSSGGAEHQELWRYLHSGPFAERAAFDAYLNAKAASEDPMYFALVDRTMGGTISGTGGRAAGHASYMRMDPGQRAIEVGAILYTPALQKTRAATEAMYLMARHAFEDLGYRRYEWKCNVLNDASQSAARRLGFSFEGVFRQQIIVEGRSRDTAWFSMLDREWPKRKREFERWLAPENFDRTGRQKTRLCHG